MYYGLNSVKGIVSGIIYGTVFGAMKGDPRVQTIAHV